MKLETSVELLERVRAAQQVSWWKLPGVLEASESTVKNWKHGRTTIDRKFAPRIAQLLAEPPEYVLACLENEREQSEEVKKLWQRIATKFRSKVASVLLAVVSGALLGNAGISDARASAPSIGTSPSFNIMVSRRRKARNAWLPALA